MTGVPPFRRPASVSSLSRIQQARYGVAVVFHNTLASSEYDLLDENTVKPRHNYWAALLWHRLMGTAVLDAGPSHPPGPTTPAPTTITFLAMADAQAPACR